MTSGVILTFWHKCDIMNVIGVPCFAAFFCAILSAFFDISVAIIFALGNSFFSVMAIHPEPVPTSTITGLSGICFLLG